ncbi:MAG TPA: mucoidy inhibitor MuiA family protein [Gemmataceae bacterium]|nr:mucoidy inhibitor MuiA family protein [Gemmataceae bacterium]
MRKWLSIAAAVLGVGLVSGVGYTFLHGAPEAAQEQPKIAVNKIAKVVVYPNSALVTREVDVPAGAGIIEVVVSSLPVRVISSSLYSEGTNGIRVLSTRYRTRQVEEDTREAVRKGEEEKAKLEAVIEKLNADLRAADENIKMIGKLENFTSVTTVSTAEKGGFSADTAIGLTKYVMEQRTEKTKEIVALNQQLKNNQKQLDFVNRKLREISAGSSKVERDAVIVIDRDKGGAGKVKLNYLVTHVAWAPQYKLRAGKANEDVKLDYLATLVQQSGEDWNGVDLTLSTALPMLNAAPPELRKLEISVIPLSSLPPGFAGGGKGGKGGGGDIVVNPGQPTSTLTQNAVDLRGQAQQAGTTEKYKDVDKLLNEAAAWEQTLDLTKSRADLMAENVKGRSSKDDAPSVTYHLKHILSVPSRNDEQVVEVAKLSLSPKYYYKAVPLLNTHVYRQADLVNKSEYVLFPGEATMYQGTDFVGRMSIPLVAVGEEFTAGFGIDPQLQIQRMMMDKTRTMQGGNQVLKYEYRIMVSSYKPEKVQVQVWDRLPMARETESTGVSLLKTAPELSKDSLYLREQRPNNLLRWDLEVDPAMNGEKALTINYEFRLELDKQMVINVLQTREAPELPGFGGFGGGKGGGGAGGGGAGKGGK